MINRPDDVRLELSDLPDLASFTNLGLVRNLLHAQITVGSPAAVNGHESNVDSSNQGDGEDDNVNEGSMTILHDEPPSPEDIDIELGENADISPLSSAVVEI
jgi:hypothetical protein